MLAAFTPLKALVASSAGGIGLPASLGGSPWSPAFSNIMCARLRIVVLGVGCARHHVTWNAENSRRTAGSRRCPVCRHYKRAMMHHLGDGQFPR